MSHYLSPGAYLPHDAPMLLLERVLNVSEEQATCQVTVTRRGVLAPFIDASGNLPGWYALELMAQTVGVWSGWHRQQNGEAQISLGMVLGARELKCVAGEFAADSVLEVTVTLLMQDERFGSFECEIIADGKKLASGRVNTFQPTSEELNSLFEQRKSS
ncbi:3-hydroxy-fatty acyl-ACP dehydratase [Scandinavium sp. V105_16]|uniref:3-hydroxy-fatty acyl-ACP dehydratase n=1 Tax=Scandinavium lactucae TaxID=3095028 RepID=A0AAJ2S5S9_9ENTR|nr:MULTISPECIES: 3-hydroxy-fatty acyl-ACP dehydratase [unclassified Scandinavium]MDX6019358.1 3-hydroxy-fatty acyl-ACP dehydratase [Scandinavium sp. V105_16]MDX6030486.1 3-hydroxy-fatty acyl-ACP dehydratase [Scandinavium sp. V105_12]MDX6039477.1 3-hydroxy-fatty acyl-ACP dehydratase [Scandinavium sp. V105_6]MDX6048939.1 3-hydroxy-fatty acyl-ACP dehydratase [Scandinavium sp. V105_1]